VPGPDPNEEGLRALGRAVDTGGAPPPRRRPGPAHASSGRRHPGATGRKRKRRWLRRTLVIAAVLVLLVVGSVVGYGIYLNHEVHRITVNGLAAGSTTGSDAGTENILMVGSTTRCGLAHQTINYGLCTEGVTGVNSDVVMILHLDPATKAVSILSIPRDLFVPNARSTGAYKIDAALAQGPTQLVAVVEEDFGIPIQHYVELNFDTFAAIVTALGGITMEFPDRIYDRYSGLRVLTTGCHHLDGVEALQVVRARHLQYWVTGDAPTTPSTWPQEGQSDLARIERDHEFLRVLATKVASRGLGNPAADLSLINALVPDLTVDSGLSASDMLSLVLTFHSVDIDKAPQLTLPVLVGNFGTYLYEGSSYGDVEFPSEPVDQSVIDQFLGITSDTGTMTGEPLPSPGSVSVSVLDGTGVTGQATQTEAALGHLGFDTIGTGSATPVGNPAETLVTYSHRTPSDEAAAQLVADSLSGSVVLDYGPTADGADVTVTTGTSFTVDSSVPAPASAGTTTTTGVTSATAATTAVTSAATTSTATTDFAPPSSSNPALTSYDPRACPAGVTGNLGNW
jgi:LCP family protein required for cell wall assembly